LNGFVFVVAQNNIHASTATLEQNGGHVLWSAMPRWNQNIPPLFWVTMKSCRKKNTTLDVAVGVVSEKI
jgi:hypothetical protein